MLKKFLHGLAFGAGFAVAIIVVMVMFVSDWGVTTWFAPGERGVVSSGPEVDAPPALSEARRFLGSAGIYSGDSDAFRRGGTLAAGPGKIVGKVTSNGAPVATTQIRSSAIRFWIRPG